jgi:2-oxoglutarate ferredoxin oxidoreductase subunit gamma
MARGKGKQGKGAQQAKNASPRREYQMRLSGSGGQGLQLSAKILVRALSEEGKVVAQSQSYEPTSRGGLSRSDLVVGDGEPDYPLATAVDYMLVLDQVAVKACDGIVSDGGTVITDSRLVSDPPAGDFRIIALPITDTAIGLGNIRVANVVGLGAMTGLSGICKAETMQSVISATVPAKYRELNLDAFSEGLKLAASVG